MTTKDASYIEINLPAAKGHDGPFDMETDYSGPDLIDIQIMSSHPLSFERATVNGVFVFGFDNRSKGHGESYQWVTVTNEFEPLPIGRLLRSEVRIRHGDKIRLVDVNCNTTKPFTVVIRGREAK